MYTNIPPPPCSHSSSVHFAKGHDWIMLIDIDCSGFWTEFSKEEVDFSEGGMGLGQPALPVEMPVPNWQPPVEMPVGNWMPSELPGGYWQPAELPAEMRTELPG